jgi:hypothetical protein
MGPHEFDGINHLAIHLSGAALVMLSDDLVDGTIAHEYLHYVWFSVRLMDAYRNGEATLHLGRHDYLDSFRRYKQIDALMAADPQEWLSVRLASLVKRVEDSFCPECWDSDARIIREWIGAGLPSCGPDLGFSVDDLWIDEDLLANDRKRPSSEANK